MADRSPICTKTQIVSVWTLAREPHSSVPRPRLIIPFSVVFFHLRHLLGLFKPCLATIEKTNLWKVLTLKLVINRFERTDEVLAHTTTTVNHHCGGAGQPSFPGLHLAISNRATQRCIALPQGSPIVVDLIKKCGLEKKGRAIEKGSPGARFTGDEIAVGATQRDDRKELQVLGETMMRHR